MLAGAAAANTLFPDGSRGKDESMDRRHVFGETYRDEQTGATVRVLVGGSGKNQVIYQTHPMWTPGMSHLLFVSDRTGGRWLPHVLELGTGEVWCAAAEGAEDWTLARKEGLLYFRRGDNLYVSDIEEKDGKGWPIASFDGLSALRPISMSLDADEAIIYAGATLEPEKQWGIAVLDVAGGAYRVAAAVSFRVGHVQANPFVPGIIMFCHETGGDAPQRMWVVHADGSHLHPFYKETYEEWVTHEVWWGPRRAIFTIWPYDEAHKKLPHGVVSAHLDTGVPTVHSQFPAWHTHGSPDGRWAVADDFDGNLWLIDVAASERRLLTQGHRRAGFDTHLHPSFTPDSKAVVFNSSRNNSDDVFLVDVPDWGALPVSRE